MLTLFNFLEKIRRIWVRFLPHQLPELPLNQRRLRGKSQIQAEVLHRLLENRIQMLQIPMIQSRKQMVQSMVAKIRQNQPVRPRNFHSIDHRVQLADPPVNFFGAAWSITIVEDVRMVVSGIEADHEEVEAPPSQDEVPHDEGLNQRVPPDEIHGEGHGQGYQIRRN